MVDPLISRQRRRTKAARGKKLRTMTMTTRAKKLRRNIIAPPSCFTLSKKEIDQFFKCLVEINVSSGYSGKISRYLDPKKQRFSGMKSHDCHVMMTQILPVAFRGIMDKHVHETLIG